MEMLFNGLNKTVLEKYFEGIDIYEANTETLKKFMLQSLKQGEYSLPVAEVLAMDFAPEIGQQLIKDYEEAFPLVDTSVIPDRIKVLQASLNKSLMFGINLDKPGFPCKLYTANVLCLDSLKENKFRLDKTVEKNMQYTLHAMEVRITTKNGNTEVEPISLNKNTAITVSADPEEFTGIKLIPYAYIRTSMMLIKYLLDSYEAIGTEQQMDEVTKKRIISTKKSVLKRFTDDEDFPNTLDSSYFPLLGFMYAPVLGASSMTAGVTKIDFFKLTGLSTNFNINSVRKATMQDYFEDLVVTSYFQDLRSMDIDKFNDAVAKLPNSRDILTGAVSENSEGISITTLTKYFHSLTPTERKKVLKAVPEADSMLKTYQSLFKMKKDIKGLSVDEVQEILKNGVVKALIRKEDGKYSSLLVSNNPAVLENLYGKYYFANKESLGPRLWKFSSMVSGKDGVAVSYSEAIDYCGFSNVSTDIQDKMCQIVAKKGDNKAAHEALLGLFDKKSRRASEFNSTTLMARNLISGVGETYYKNLDLSKVVTIYQIS